MSFFLRGVLKARILMSIKQASPKILNLAFLLSVAFDTFFF